METYRPACHAVWRQLIQDSKQILIQERGFSPNEAHEYLYQLAEADKLFVAEVADRIVHGRLVLAGRPYQADTEVSAADGMFVTLIKHPNGDTRMQLTKVLLVDDEPAITDNLGSFLERSGFSVAVAGDGERALHQVAAFKPDLIVLDVLMPRLDGREVLRRLRQAGNWIPVILLTQIGEAAERAMALEEGADDYLNKPFDPHELVARIRAVLRRSQAGQRPLMSAERLTSEGLVFDRRARRAWLGSQELTLTPKALALLEYLMTHPDELLTRDRLLDAVWGWDYPAGIRAVDTRIAELRRALGDDAMQPRYVETVPAQGYRFVGSVEVGR